jgi:hypothetical protein
LLLVMGSVRLALTPVQELAAAGKMNCSVGVEVLTPGVTRLPG